MKIPKGKLIPIGGKEARDPEDEKDVERLQPIAFYESGVLKEVLAEMKGTESRIEVITTASRIPEEMGKMYTEAFRNLGCEHVGVLHLDGRNVNSQETMQRLEKADGVFFTGGDQTRLSEKIGDTAFLERLRVRYMQEEFVIAGTSAGAMAMSNHMIKEGYSSETLLKGIAEMGTGFGLLPQAVIDTHFMRRGRFARLTDALLQCPACIGLGIGEDTGLVITEGHFLRTIGSGVALVVEADEISQTNYQNVQKMEPVFVEGLQIHFLAKGASYSLRDRKFIVDIVEIK